MDTAADDKQPAKGRIPRKEEKPLPDGKFSHKQATLMRKGFPAVALVFLGTGVAMAQSPYESSADFAKYARKLREQALLKVEPQVFVPTASRTSTATRYPWKSNIVTTVFWVGEQAGGNNRVPKYNSCWGAHRTAHDGGRHTPARTR